MNVYAAAEDRRESLESFAHPPDGDDSPLILIVDDDEDSRGMLKFLLETWSYSVAEAADGFEACYLAEEMRPALILMDARLPKIDGFEATRLIRESVNVSRTPIVFLSGCAEEVYRQCAASVGADDYLVKPIDFGLLEYTLNKYFCRQQTSIRENP